MAGAQVAAATVGEEIRARPPWLVALLELLSENFYEVWWFGRSWRELKRARNDPNMHPVWHALAIYVPIYGLFRLHAHYRVLNETASAAGGADRVSPSLMVILAIVRGCVGWVSGSIAFNAIWPVVMAAINTAMENPGVTPVIPSVALPPSVLLLTLVGYAIGAWQMYRGQEVLNGYYATRSGVTLPRVLTIEWIFVALFALRFLSDVLPYTRGGT